MDRFAYTDPDDVILLKDPDKLREMLSLAAEMADSIENKTEFYGPFHKMPDKVCVLPGIQPAFQKFLREVEKIDIGHAVRIMLRIIKKVEQKKALRVRSILIVPHI